MTDLAIWLSWVGVIVIVACIGMYMLYKRGKIPRLKGKGIKMPKMFEPKADTQIERLKAQTGREVAKAEELRSVLEAKTELAKARAENIKLQKAIDGVSEKSVEKERQEALEAQNVKPRRL